MKKRRLVWMFLLLICLSADMGCNRADQGSIREIPVNERMSQSDPPLISAETSGQNRENKHGLLESPHFNPDLVQLTDKRMELSPRITETLSRGGRYYQACSIDDNRFAIACLRGVDFFRLDSDTPDPYLQVDTLGEAWSIHRVGHTLWVADGYAGVCVLDMDTGKNVVQWPKMSNARSFHRMADGRIVVCRHSSGADILTLSDDVTIQTQVHVDISSRIVSAASTGNRLFLGTLHGGYVAMDAEPEHPVRTLWTFSGCTRVVWCSYLNGYHYLLDQDVGLLILVDKGEQPPELVETLALAGQSRHACFMNPDRLLIANQRQTYLIDVTDPRNPSIKSHLRAILEEWGISVIGSALVATESEYGFRILTANNDVLKENRAYVHNGLVADVRMVGKDRAVMANTHRGLFFLSVDQETISMTDQWNACWYPVATFAEDSLLAVTDYRSVILLQTNGIQPVRELARINTPGRAVNVDGDGHYLYIADWFEGMQIVDISDPTRPVIVSSVRTEGWVIDVNVGNGYAYLCSVNQGLMTIDIRDPLQPALIHCENSALAPEAVAIGNQCLYVADFNFGLIIYDLSDPAQPVPASCYRMDVCKNVCLRDNLLIVANYVNGLKWFDIREPFRPVLIGELDTPGKSYGVSFIPERNEALIADWHDLLRVAW
ncbi:hypothetical protein JW823_02765 [bacterium]|nr:hypothetical protein [candidate division CSSED10-310 bacterium]